MREWLIYPDFESPAGIGVRGLLASTLAAIQQWHRGSDCKMVKVRVAAEVGPYLGSKATRNVLEDVSPEGGNLFSKVEPVLALFVGVKAAERLVTHIVDVSITRS
jgi:hypothetical protein